MQVFGRHMQRLPTTQHSLHQKYVHNLQPLGMAIFQCSPTKDPALKRCPCCQVQGKDQYHFILCKSNPSRTEALASLVKATFGTNNLPFGIALAMCIKHSIQTPNNAVVPLPLEKYHTRYHTLLLDVTSAQSQVGW
jgi:hypothetical protein